MWYHTVGNYWINTETVLYDELREIAENNSEYFLPDELIDEIYGSVNYFGVVFYPHQIIHKLDEQLYQEIWDEQMSNWTDEAIWRLERVDPKDGDLMSDVLDEDFIELKNIVWKESEVEIDV